MEKEPRYFTIKQFNRISFEAAHAIVKYRKAMRLLDKSFRKHIMLTVSGVNSCKACSHVHAKGLIKEGVDVKVTDALVNGEFSGFSEDITIALLFAKHYADVGGFYESETFAKIVEYYGQDKANGIMATIKIIMFGNTNGIALTNLVNRLRFKRNKNSKFFPELYNGLFAYFLLPLFLLINIFTKKKKY